MNSLGVFFDLNLKKSNDLMEVFDEALSKTNNLMETMDNFNTHKKIERINDNIESTKNDIYSYNIVRKNNKLRTYNPKKANKAKLNPIKNNQYSFRKREPYNYQKAYENELINQIEKLFNPSYQNNQKNGKKEEVGMLSFLSPLINSNIDEKNKKFYKTKKNLDKSKSSKVNELNANTINNNNEKENDISLNETESFLSRQLNHKYSNNSNSSQKLRISKKNTFARMGNNYYDFEGDKFRGYNSIGKKFRSNGGFKKKKYDIPEVGELKKNRYFSRTKTNFRNAIVARDVSGKSGKNESNVDQLINKLKKHYS